MSGSNLSDAFIPPADAAVRDQPLGLTVHTVPTPADMAGGHAQRTVRGRLKMLAVMLVCAAPVVASYFTFYVIRPEGRRNFGELINPQRPLPDQTAVTLDGRAVNLQSLRGQWLLVSVGGGACDATCERHLYLQRQLREGLGRDKDRVDWVWLVTDDAPVAAPLQAAIRGAAVLRMPADAVARWLAPAAGHTLADQLYLVDPTGHWMMRFPSVSRSAAPHDKNASMPPLEVAGVSASGAVAALDTASAAKIKRDIERVLRASASWDEAGRGGR